MRALSRVLFVAGLPWALISWIAVGIGPAGAFEDLPRVLARPELLPRAILMILAFFLLSAHAASGYVVWSRWFLIASGKRSPSRRFWTLAAMHHLAWVLLAAPWNGRYALSPLFPAIFWYSLAVLICCTVAALLAGGGGVSADSQGSGAVPAGYSAV